MPNNLVKQLKQVPLFAGLSRDDLRAVAKLVKRAHYPPGREISRQGQIGLTPGDHFGETSLLLGEPLDATVEIVQETDLLYLNKDDFDRLLEERPAMLKALRMRSDVEEKHRVRSVHFKWQDPDEVVIVSRHRHDVMLIRNIIVPCFALLVVLLGCIYLYRRFEASLILVVGALLALFLLLFTLYLFLDHRDEIYIVTNKRVVRRQHTPLGRESRVDAPLRAVQDIQESQVGLLAQLYNFGDLIIETAGERGHVAFREILDPEGIREIIFEQIHRLQAGAKAEERAAIRDDMQRYFDIQFKEEEEPPAPPPPPQKRRSRSAVFEWLRAPLRFFTYFLPSLRYEQGDTITWRKHWIALLKPIALPTLLATAATIIAGYFLLQAPSARAPTLIGYGVALVFLLPWWLWRFDDWQNDIYQVTSTRIIDVERLPFYLREDRREASLGMIQNVQFEIPSTLGRFLNYGSVTIETAGAGAFTFDRVKDPSGVQAEIFRRMETFQSRQSQAAAERHRSELLDWFAVYDQMYHSTPPSSRPPSSYPQET
jgi:uncharacterized membrane protein YdbT with pleckstrin-like domain